MVAAVTPELARLYPLFLLGILRDRRLGQRPGNTTIAAGLLSRCREEERVLAPTVLELYPSASVSHVIGAV